MIFSEIVEYTEDCDSSGDSLTACVDRHLDGVFPECTGGMLAVRQRLCFYLRP